MLAVFQVVETDAREVRCDDAARALGLGKRDEVVRRLVKRLVQVFAQALVFDDQLAGDKAVNEASRAAKFVHGLFIDRGGLWPDAEALIEPGPEQLRIGGLAVGASPGLGEGGQAAADFDAGKAGHSGTMLSVDATA